MVIPLSLNRVVVFAPDIANAQRFFREVLGLRLVSADDQTLTFQGQGFLLTVFRSDDIDAADRYSQRPGVSVAFGVPSLEAAIFELSAQNVRFLHVEPKIGPVGRYVAFTDPFGTVFELVEEQ